MLSPHLSCHYELWDGGRAKGWNGSLKRRDERGGKERRSWMRMKGDRSQTGAREEKSLSDGASVKRGEKKQKKRWKEKIRQRS